MTEEQGARKSPDANTDKKSLGKDVGKLVSGMVVACMRYGLVILLPKGIQTFEFTDKIVRDRDNTNIGVFHR